MRVTVSAKGLAEFRKALRQIDRDLGKELRQVWLRVAKLVESRAKPAAPATAGKAIRARATQRAAFLRITPKRGDELAVFLGQKQRSGWYGRRRYRRSSGRQHRPWVGNQWDPGEQGGKPYFIGDPINRTIPEVIDMLGDEIEALAAKTIK